jgi:hypothetical protein
MTSKTTNKFSPEIRARTVRDGSGSLGQACVAVFNEWVKKAGRQRQTVWCSVRYGRSIEGVGAGESENSAGLTITAKHMG